MVSEAKSYWTKEFGDLNNPYLEYFKLMFKKNPGYIGPFFKLYFLSYYKKFTSASFLHNTNIFNEKGYDYTLSYLENDYDLIASIKRSYQLLLKYKQLFSDIDFNNFRSTEQLEDYLNNQIIYNERKVFVKKFVSSKYSTLINDDTILLFDNLRKTIGDDHKTFNQLILSKIASFKSSKEFNSFLKTQLNSFGNWSVDKLEKKAIECGAKIIFKNKNILIVETITYKSMKLLGSQNWCIVRDKHYFDNYLKEDNISINKQYIVFNTRLDQTNIRSMIGFTVQFDDSILGHRLDDSEIDKKDFTMYNKYLPKIDKEELKRKVIESIDSIDGNEWMFRFGFLDEVIKLKELGYNFKHYGVSLLRTAINYDHLDIVEYMFQEKLVHLTSYNEIDLLDHANVHYDKTMLNLVKKYI